MFIPETRPDGPPVRGGVTVPGSRKGAAVRSGLPESDVRSILAADYCKTRLTFAILLAFFDGCDPGRDGHFFCKSNIECWNCKEFSRFFADYICKSNPPGSIARRWRVFCPIIAEIPDLRLQTAARTGILSADVPRLKMALI